MLLQSACRPQCVALLPFLFLPLLAQTGGPGAPGAANLQLKAEARLVLVDTVVTDKKDEPIHGLTAKDFRVFEDGKEQTVTAFQTHTGPATAGISQQQHFVLLFDGHSTDDQKWIEQAATKFVADNAGPNRLMSVAAYRSGCLTFAAQFTADVGQLQHALRIWPNISRCPPVHDPYGDIRAQNYTQLAKDLAQVPGHKVVALFVAHAAPAVNAASQKPQPPPRIVSQKNQRPSRRSSALERNAALSDPKGMQLEFRKADVSVYPVEGTTGAKNPGWALSLADATGGHELSRGNDVLAVFEVLAREQDESYTLGYVPKESPEGSCHALKVTVDRSDVKVRGRNLYCNVPRTTLASASPIEIELANLGAAPHAGNTAASASVPFFYEAGGAARVDLALEIPTPVLDPTEENGKLHASMDVVGMAYNLGGEVAARFSDKVRFDFDTRRQFDDFLQHPLRYEHQLKIAPGSYKLKLIFRTAKDRFGVVETPLSVEPFDAGQLSLSAIALSRDVQPITPEAAQEETDQGKKPLVFRGNRIAVSGSDLFSKTGIAEAYFEIYAPPAAGGEPVQLTMHLRLLDAQSNEQKWDSGDVDLSALAKSGSPVIPVALRLPVATLEPGTYRGELTVKDSAEGEAARSIQFRVE
ncbi:MAG: VWA domain-containing protein [Bryobacteraceae bacterium]|jgi:VWFA-related protein